MVFAVVLLIYLNFFVGAGITIYSIRKLLRGEWDKTSALISAGTAIVLNGIGVLNGLVGLFLLF